MNRKALGWKSLLLLKLRLQNAKAKAYFSRKDNAYPILLVELFFKYKS
jgi:hypothetical protein